MIKVLLLNNNRSILSNDLAEEIAARGEYDFIVATEPNVYAAARPQWVPDRNGVVAIRRVANNRDFGLFIREDDIVAVELSEGSGWNLY